MMCWWDKVRVVSPGVLEVRIDKDAVVTGQWLTDDYAAGVLDIDSVKRNGMEHVNSLSTLEYQHIQEIASDFVELWLWCSKEEAETT